MDQRTATEHGDDERVEAVAEVHADDAAAVIDDLDLGHLDYEIIALRSTMADIMRVVDTIAPGVFDQQLAIARLRLQAIEHRRREPAFETEDLVLRHRVDMYERGLGRTPTRG